MVQEMAIAAGIPPPEVRLLDAGVADAAAVGTDRTGYVVVGRRLLDELNRDETQGLLAHLVGSIGNGDLRGAAQIHSLLYVLELLIVVVLAPFARVPRRIAWEWLTYPVLSLTGTPETRSERARALIELLREHRTRYAAGMAGDDPLGGSVESPSAPWGARSCASARPSWRCSRSPRPPPDFCCCSQACPSGSCGEAGATSPMPRRFSSPGIPPGSGAGCATWARRVPSSRA